MTDIGGTMVNLGHQSTNVEISSEEIEVIRQFEGGFRILAGLIVKAVKHEIYKQASRLPEELSQSPISNSGSIVQSEKLTFSVLEVAKLLGLSRASVYEAVKTNQIPSITFGRRIFIPRTALKKMLNEEC